MATATKPLSLREASDASKQQRALAKAQDPGKAITEAVIEGKVSMTGVLRALGFDANNPTHQAALLVAQKYGLDPLRKHVIVIPNAGPYLTRDGLLEIAHSSGMLDGIVVDQETETTDEWRALVTVHRKDMKYGFQYWGRYPKSGQNKKYGPEMALARAESHALRRAFSVTGIRTLDEADELAEYGDVTATVDRAATERPAIEAVETTQTPPPQSWMDRLAGEPDERLTELATQYDHTYSGPSWTAEQIEALAEHLDAIDPF